MTVGSRLSAAQGTTPGQVNVTVKTNIAPGTYSGKIRISSTDSSVKNSPVDVPVTYKLTGTGLLVTPTSLSFAVPWGTPAPQQALFDRGGRGWWPDCMDGRGVGGRHLAELGRDFWFNTEYSLCISQLRRSRARRASGYHQDRRDRSECGEFAAVYPGQPYCG